MKSWKSTLFGAISCVAGLVLALNNNGVVLPKWLVATAGYVLAGGLGGLGLVSKDWNAHSTTDQVQAATVAETKQAIAAEGK